MVPLILHLLLVERDLMEETRKTIDQQVLLSLSDLLDLNKHYCTVLQAELGFLYQYLNFNTDLFSTILAATFTR
jgi:hypothetical protein